MCDEKQVFFSVDKTLMELRKEAIVQLSIYFNDFPLNLSEIISKIPEMKLQSFFGSKYVHRTVKLFGDITFNQLNFIVSNQSGTSPPGINPFVTLLWYSYQ